jgi:hypothetical protein
MIFYSDLGKTATPFFPVFLGILAALRETLLI